MIGTWGTLNDSLYFCIYLKIAIIEVTKKDRRVTEERKEEERQREREKEKEEKVKREGRKKEGKKNCSENK